jgi:hypothetical protein
MLEFLVFASCLTPNINACNKSLEAYYYQTSMNKYVDNYVEPFKKEYSYLAPYITAGQVVTERRLVITFTF